MKRTRLFLLMGVATLFLAGCATTQTSPESSPAGAPTIDELTSDFSRSKLITSDFVSTLTQLPETLPAQTVLHTSQPSTRFGELFLSSLQRAGFDLRIGNTQSQRWLVYYANRDENLSSNGNPIYTFIVSAGDVKLKRSYEVDQYGIRPAGSMFVRGATADDVVLDNTLFSVRSPQVASAVNDNTVANDNPAVDDTDALVAELDEPEIELNAVPDPQPLVKLQNSNALADSSRAVTGTKGLPNNDAYSEFSNMFDTGESRYKEIFKSYDVVDRMVYVFSNDSLVLGKQNKVLVKQLAKNFNSETDVMSVIGCSHGASNLENGNAYLANSRAVRVKEEFITVGLDADKVLDEGCWANVDHPRMPARGVLVEHKRIKQ